MVIDNIGALRDIYGEPVGRSVVKVLPALEKHSIHFIECSPFVVISTADKNGNLDASPRGGAPGFIKVLSEKRIAIPEAKGNRRLDSLVNIVESGKIATLFMIPGIDETLRVNGRARVNTDPEVLALFSDERNPPKTFIDIDVEEMYLHCAKAFMRSQLWDQKAQLDPDAFPTMGRMINDQVGNDGPEESRAAMRERYRPDL